MLKMDLVGAPLVLGVLTASVLILLALLALVTSSPRWDDHLINAVGAFAAGLLITVILRLARAAFRPQPGAPRRSRFIAIACLLALVLLGVIALAIAMFIDSMSFL